MPEDRLSIAFAGNQIELFMPFGLLNELMKIVPDVPMVQVIGIDNELRTLVLETILAKRDNKGVITEAVSVANLPVPKADVIRILEWAADHILDFFLDAVEAAVKASQPHQARLEKLMPSGDGSAA